MLGICQIFLRVPISIYPLPGAPRRRQRQCWPIAVWAAHLPQAQRTAPGPSGPLRFGSPPPSSDSSASASLLDAPRKRKGFFLTFIRGATPPQDMHIINYILTYIWWICIISCIHMWKKQWGVGDHSGDGGPLPVNIYIYIYVYRCDGNIIAL